LWVDYGMGAKGYSPGWEAGVGCGATGHEGEEC